MAIKIPFSGRYKYWTNYFTFKKQLLHSRLPIPDGNRYPCYGDRFQMGGTMKGVYFHQDLYVAQRIFAANPIRHLDVGSRVDGFVAHVASFREIEVWDIRPIVGPKVKNIETRVVDLMNIAEEQREITDSLSCLHALEHFGLGRYGDPVDCDGHLKGFSGLHGLLTKGGLLYFSVPLGPLRVEFDAHRIFSVNYLLEMIKNKFEIERVSFVDDAGDFHENVELSPSNCESNFGCVNEGCIILELRKTSAY